MSRYVTRLRQLEGRFGSGQCPLCAGNVGVDFHTVAPGETLPPRKVCEVCGVPRLAFVVELANDPPDTAVTDITPAPERRSKALVRRRRFYGPE
jgi:hypothetical protein